MKKKDLALIIGIVIIAVIGLFFVMMMRKDGKQVVITVDGTVYQQVSLEKDETIEVKTEHGVNVVKIENGAVSMESADCPDKVCVNHASIKKSGETIVCLPHKVVVEVTANTTQKEIDGVAQ